MPVYEYKCEPCAIEFEEMLLHREEIASYADWHPCPSCGQRSERNRVAMFGFSFKGDVRGTSGVHGNSGVHDLDYPTLDKAVARSADKRWQKFSSQQSEMVRLRRESGNHAITYNDGKFESTSSDHLQKRSDLLSKLSTPKKTD
jgi:putative FmdB family regulatory protein